MSRFGYVMATYIAIIGVGALAFFHPAARLIWNATASTPIGLYEVRPVGELSDLDIVAVRPPERIANFLARGGYLPKGLPLLKHVLALPGQTVCRSGDDIFVDRIDVGVAHDRDHLGRPLPRWSGCHRLRPGEVFLMNPAVPDLDAAADGPMGSIVELRKFDDAQGRRRVALAVRSDLSIERQINATGATWLDRQAIAREPVALGQAGFGAEVRDAMARRTEQLIGQGLAERQAGGVAFARNLIGTLRRRELEALGERLAAETGRPLNASAAGEYVTGTYRQRFSLASGRFAMIDDGLGFQLVPWSPSLEKQLGRHVSGVARGDGGIDWGFGRSRGLGL